MPLRLLATAPALLLLAGCGSTDDGGRPSDVDPGSYSAVTIDLVDVPNASQSTAVKPSVWQPNGEAKPLGAKPGVEPPRETLDEPSDDSIDERDTTDADLD